MEKDEKVFMRTLSLLASMMLSLSLLASMMPRARLDSRLLEISLHMYDYLAMPISRFSV